MLVRHVAAPAFGGVILPFEARARKEVSRSASESASASLHPNRPRPTFHEWRSLIPARKQRESTGGVVRGGWERRASKDKLRNLGDPCGWVRPNSFAECIRRRGPARKSDAFIVAGKRVTTVERRDATVGQPSLRQGVPLDRRVHYGRRGLCSRRGNAAEQLFAEMDAGPDRDAGTCEPRRASSRPTGEPDAGNPHVRFDEGGGIPAPTLPCRRSRACRGVRKPGPPPSPSCRGSAKNRGGSRRMSRAASGNGRST